MKRFQSVLAAIFDKSFWPDATSSLYFDNVPQVVLPDEANPAERMTKTETESVEVKDELSVVVPSCAEAEMVDSSSDLSGDCSDSGEAHDEEPDVVVELRRKIRRVASPEASGASWMFHKRSGILHLRDWIESEPSLGSKYFRCGRVVGNNYYL